MNLLILGSGKGSWTMRGEQLGAALKARVTTDPTPDDWDWASVVVLVKHAGAKLAADAHRRHVPIVWDALDFWSQPRDNGLSEDRARGLLASALDRIRPRVFIGATPAMAEAGGGVFLPHHSWAGLVPTDARAHVSVVAYQGNERFLGRWHEAIQVECARRDWSFVVNPADLSQADLIVSFRDGVWDGWMCRQWKSGVKAVNALAAGRPFITQACSGAQEAVDATTVESRDELSAVFDRWSDYSARQAVVDLARHRAPARTVDVVAALYTSVIAPVWQVAA